MPVGSSTFSVATQYQLEVATNIIGWDGVTLTTRTTIGIRRMSGSGGGLAGSIPVNIGSQTASGGVGDVTTFTVDFGSTNYVELTSYTVSQGTPGVPWPATDTWIDIKAWVDAVDAPAWGNANVTVRLDIPPAAPVTWPSFSPSTFAAGTPITISLPRVNSTYTHDVYYTFGGYVDDLIATGVGTSISTTPPTTLLSQIPNSNSGVYTVTAVTRTASGSEVGRRSFSGTMTVPSSSVPTVSGYSVSDTNTTVATEVGTFVQGLSTLKLNSITATASMGATIEQRRLGIEGAQLQINDTRTLLNPGTIPVLAQAWDSRGLLGTLSGGVNVLAYTSPGSDTRVIRSNASGVAQDDGAYLTIVGTSFIKSLINTTERNAMTLKVFTKPFADTTWTARNVLTPTTITSAGKLLYNTNIVVSGGAIYSRSQPHRPQSGPDGTPASEHRPSRSASAPS